MKRQGEWMLMVGLVFLGTCCGCEPPENGPSEDTAITEIEKLGGEFTPQGRWGSKVDLTRTKVTDKGVKNLRQALPNCLIWDYAN